jgi:hypothetical protein
MAEPIDSAWSSTVLSDTNLNATTYGQGTSFPSTWSTTRIFFRTDLNQIYQNTGTEASPSWKNMSGSPVTEGSGVQPVNTTIGDYSQPASATSSSAKADYVDGTTTIVHAVSSFANHYGNSAYFAIDSDAVGREVHSITCFLARDNTSNNQSQTYNIYNSSNVLQQTGSSHSYSGVSTHIQSGGTGRSSTFSGYTIQSGDTFKMVASGGGNHYFDGTTSNASYQIVVDNLVTYSASNVVDNDTTREAQTNSETNPWIAIGLSASAVISQIAIWKVSDTTETEIQIQTSPDNSTWTTQRTINTSDLTAGQYEYIRINNIDTQYIRVYGSSGVSKILALSELKIFTPTNDQMTLSHGHLTIDSTDTSLELDGT